MPLQNGANLTKYCTAYRSGRTLGNAENRCLLLEASKTRKVRKRRRERTQTYVTEERANLKKYCTAYRSKQASPKLKNRYPFSTASLYIARHCSLPMKAETSMMRVLSGRWKLVMSASTHLNLYGG